MGDRLTARLIAAAAFVVILVIACGPVSAAGRDGCPDADQGMDYCGLCKSTGQCHYCSSTHCVADVCSCGATITCGAGTHDVNGVCVLGSSSSGGSSGTSTTSSSTSSSSTSSSGDIGLPCTTGAHPAWQDGECGAATTCKFCSIRACARATQQGCCAGEDTPSQFFPCDGCTNCTNAVKSAFADCGCNQ